ncbi:hypothetical protein HAZT_HAZT009682 [Hyalella azteca]|uniref:Uncharacterized protein LOC108668529 n=1 Tax=Hyalella azteca TaxID=294128 RepID=A0A6A0GZK7_HYAAZ|nr:uncharacterized protein LOC108668529 [Hyalella azteca]KAA0193992.1 hypothetical protein HAZT_HAZT009682 [Hyalella azteca]
MSECGVTGGLSSDPKDCTKFYECSNGKAIRMSCPGGSHFTPSLLDEVLRFSSGPRLVLTVPTSPSPEAQYPGPHGCTKYFHCVPYLKSCHPGKDTGVSCNDVTGLSTPCTQ